MTSTPNTQSHPVDNQHQIEFYTSTPDTQSQPIDNQRQTEPFATATALPIPVVLVQRDLAEKLGILPGDIEVKSIEEVLWPDTCLGLPAPELCARGETIGYLVILNVFNQDYIYHTDSDQMFRYAGPGDFPTKP